MAAPIAFLSDRDGGEAGEKADQVWAMALNGGEAVAVTHGEEEVHAFAWASDSRQIYFATRTPWSKPRQEAYKKDWNDVVEFRESERGDSIARVELITGAVHQIAATPWRVKQLEDSPDGKTLAFLTDSVSERQEAMDAYGIYLVDAAGGQPRALIDRPAVYESMHWAPDRPAYFLLLLGWLGRRELSGCAAARVLGRYVIAHARHAVG